MSRKLYIVGNWKMNHNAAATRAQIAALKAQVGSVTKVDIGICPAFTSLPAAVEAAAGSNIKIGAQNVHWDTKGAFTSQIAADMLLEIPVKYSIVGHSECRQFFGDTNTTVNQRTKAALAAGLDVIQCCGELIEERRAGKTTAVVTAQVTEGLAGISAADMARITIAYEPVWAIGTGETATPAQAQEVHAMIRGLVKKLYGAAVADAVRIQYGGSVKASNVAELMSQADIDGALVGGASLKADDFAALIKNAC